MTKYAGLKKKIREYAAEHGLSYQAARNEMLKKGLIYIPMGITAACESRGTADNPTHVVCDNR